MLRVARVWGAEEENTGGPCFIPGPTGCGAGRQLAPAVWIVAVVNCLLVSQGITLAQREASILDSLTLLPTANWARCKKPAFLIEMLIFNKYSTTNRRHSQGFSYF